MTDRQITAEKVADSIEQAAVEKMLKHLPKLYELMLDIPGTHRERMFNALRALLQGVP